MDGTVAAGRAGLIGTAAAVALAIVGCAHQDAARSSAAASSGAERTTATNSPPPEPDVALLKDVEKAQRQKGVVVDGGMVHTEPVEAIAAWMLYGGNRAALAPAVLTKNRAADDFLVEVVSRDAMAESWVEERAKGTAPNVYLDLMVRVHRESLMPNYVLGAFARPGWFLDPVLMAKLDFARYRAFAAKELQGHRPRRPVFFFPEHTPVFPRVPGSTLPAASTLDPAKVSCRDSATLVAAGLARWATEKGTFDGVPLAATDRAGFLRAVEKVRAVPPYSEQGVTWVARAVSDLFMVAGFCAVEFKKWADAETYLRETIALDPLDAGTRGELALVYAEMHRLDDADKVMAEALPLATNDCERARLTRRQGYLQIERGSLLEALQTYNRSLELDPGHPIALKEIEVIMTELRRQGGEAAAKANGYVPPPRRPGLNTTACPR